MVCSYKQDYSEFYSYIIKNFENIFMNVLNFIVNLETIKYYYWKEEIIIHY